MPAKWFRCPDNGKTEIATCLCEGGCRMASRCAPPAYLKMVAYERTWTGVPSTTQLIQGTMLAYLKLTREYSVYPDDRAFAVHGTKVHQNLQANASEFSENEGVLGGKITGIFDSLIQENDKNTLVDYKTSGSFKVAKALGFHVTEKATGDVYKSGKRKGEAKTVKTLDRADDMIDRWEWELQLNNYRIEVEKRRIRVHDMRIACMVRDGNTWMARSRGVLRNLYYFPIRRIADHVVLRYFEAKRKALFIALEQGWDKPCSVTENWNGLRCERYCEVAEFCVLGKFLQKERKAMDMPIKGLSDVTRLPRIGKIRLGVKALSSKGVEYPKEIEYFLLDPETPKEADRTRLINDFSARYGEKPTSIKIMLPIGEIDVVFPQFYKRYGSTTLLKCKGDGETAFCGSVEFAEGLEILNQENDLIEVRCDGKDCPYFAATPKQCSAVGTLNVLLYEMEGAGVWQINTGSINSIINLNSGMQFLQAAAGRFHMIPLVLERRPQEMQREGGKATHYPLHLNVEKSLAELQAFAQIDASMIMLELPAADEEAVDLALEQATNLPVDAPDVPFDMPESALNEVANALADILGIDVVTFGQFVENNFDETEIGFLRAALKEDGYARTELQKRLKTWLDTVEDAPEAPPANDGEDVIEMESAEAIDEKLKAKQQLVAELVTTTPLEGIDKNGFTTWWKLLMPEEADKSFLELNELALDVIIGAIEAKQGDEADTAAEGNGTLF